MDGLCDGVALMSMLTIEGARTPSTHLGFGCSLLMGGSTRAESLRLLDIAFEAGIRHFDTAPSYGYGQAESVLGEASRPRRDQVTITTKFGLRPPPSQRTLGMLHRVVRPLVRRFPGIKSRLSRAAGGLTSRAPFTPDDLRISIEASLRALQTDHIDILLLHEAGVDDLSDGLFAQLERSIAEGKIGNFGVGSDGGVLA
ncbi:MAG: aldo/keto reductase, partial [Alphaproteobacteria bacterium]|nr:aldo/keto reductase [Alphaproteobacteria bacterium]